jgi:hypothetical protein
MLYNLWAATGFNVTLFFLIVHIPYRSSCPDKVALVTGKISPDKTVLIGREGMTRAMNHV